MKGNSVHEKWTSQKLEQGQVATLSISAKVQNPYSFKEIRRGIYNRSCQGPLALILRHQNKSSCCALKLGTKSEWTLLTVISILQCCVWRHGSPTSGGDDESKEGEWGLSPNPNQPWMMRLYMMLLYFSCITTYWSFFSELQLNNLHFLLQVLRQFKKHMS